MTPSNIDINITDIYLSGGQDFALTNVNDLEMVGGSLAIANDAIRCILVQRGTWDGHPNFGSELHNLLKLKTPSQVTNDEVYDVVLDAVADMLQSKRLTSVDSVIITKVDKNSITLQIVFVINQQSISATITETV